MISRRGNIEAIKFLKELGLKHPTELSIEEIAISQGAFVEMTELEGCEGRIVFDEDEAIISVNSKITYPPKRRYVIGHEIGHFRMHKNLTPGYIDNEKSLSEWYAKGQHELEANTFASELLLPQNLVSPLFKGRRFNLELIYEVAEEFQTSVTSTLLRYRDLGDFPIALILVKNGSVEWTQFTNDFPLEYIPKGSRVSPHTVAGDYFFNHNELEEQPEQIPAIEWFPEDFNIEKYQSWNFYEQCHHVAPNTILACLWTY